jgi:predicted N-acyltransferase
VVVTSNSALLERARMVGGPFSFSGPLRPGDLGASVASARIHLSPELPLLRAKLRDRVAQTNSLCRSLGIPLVIDNETPIRFIALGRPEAVFLLAELVREDGFHVNVSGFPAVPASRGGLRIAINAIHSAEQVDSLLHAIARRLPEALSVVGVTKEEVIDQFYGVLPSFMHKTASSPTTLREPEKSVGAELLLSQTYTRIDALDTKEWDATVGQQAYIDAASMRAVESIFPTSHEQPEYRWNCHYVMVRDQAQQLQAAAPLTTCLVKDDTYMSAVVSAALEQERLADPYLFTSKAVLAGNMASEGQHVYLRDGALQESALIRLVDSGLALMKSEQAAMFVLGNFLEDESFPRLAKVLAGQGMVPLRVPDSHMLNLDWQGESAFISSLPNQRRRNHVFKTNEQSEHFRCEVWDRHHDLDDDSLSRLHELYMKLAHKNLRINIFPIPRELLRAHLQSGTWEFIVLWRRDERYPLPVAWAAVHHVGEERRALYCGVDYNGFEIHKLSPYRQLLWQIVRRAGQQGCRRLHLGMGADHEKHCFGTVATPTYAFVRGDNDYQAQQLQEFVSRLAIEPRSTQSGGVRRAS